MTAYLEGTDSLPSMSPSVSSGVAQLLQQQGCYFLLQQETRMPKLRMTTRNSVRIEESVRQEGNTLSCDANRSFCTRSSATRCLSYWQYWDKIKFE